MMGCAKYHVMSLEPLKPDFHESALEKDDVCACCSVLDVAACKRYFCRDLLKRGFQPVQVTILNNSQRTLLLNLSQCSLPSAPADQVAKTAHFSTAGRATGYGIAALFIWPFLIPAIIDGVGSSKANTQMDYEFAAKALKDQVIRPYDMVNGVLFVPVEQMSPNLLLRLVDRQDGTTLDFAWSEGLPLEAYHEPVESHDVETSGPANQQ